MRSWNVSDHHDTNNTLRFFQMIGSKKLSTAMSCANTYASLQPIINRSYPSMLWLLWFICEIRTLKKNVWRWVEDLSKTSDRNGSSKVTNHIKLPKWKIFRSLWLSLLLVHFFPLHSRLNFGFRLYFRLFLYSFVN